MFKVFKILGINLKTAKNLNPKYLNNLKGKLIGSQKIPSLKNVSISTFLTK